MKPTHQNTFAAGAICLVVGALAVYLPMTAALGKPEAVGRIFHRLDSDHIRETHWLGTRVMKSPDDLCTFQEIISETKPDVLIETGTAHGGGALLGARVSLTPLTAAG